MAKRTPQWVMVRNSEWKNWQRKIFVREEDGLYYCVKREDEKNYEEGMEYTTMDWKFMREPKDLIYNLGLGEEVRHENVLFVRVPGGWLCDYYHTTEPNFVFVPYSEEFKEKS